VTPLKEERKASLKKKETKSYKVILNALIAANKGITLKTAIRNLSRMRKPE
jgi:hypothetical protein